MPEANSVRGSSSSYLLLSSNNFEYSLRCFRTAAARGGLCAGSCFMDVYTYKAETAAMLD
jgi:hypothetical protein